MHGGRAHKRIAGAALGPGGVEAHTRAPSARRGAVGGRARFVYSVYWVCGPYPRRPSANPHSVETLYGSEI